MLKPVWEEQIGFADVILINKADLVSLGQLLPLNRESDG